MDFVYNFNVEYHTGGRITQLNIPLLNKPDSIVGWFRMNDGDARLNLYLSVEDSSAYQVGSAAATLLQTTLSWTRFSIPVLYGSSGNSSTAVLLYSAGGAHSDTSYVEVDNVALINNLANNNEMEFAIKTPILTLSVIDGTIYLKNISKLSLQNLDIELFNIDGRLIKTLYFTEIIPASTILVTNTSSFPIGCYFIAVKSKSTSGIFKLFIFN